MVARNGSCDTHGRPYLKKDEAKAGMVIVVDDGFSCISPWRKTTLAAAEDGKLFFQCEQGHHYLVGQLADDGTCYVGVYDGSLPEWSAETTGEAQEK